jgi:hypothetical protein
LSGGEEKKYAKKTTLGAVLAIAGMFATTAYFVSPARAKADDAPITTYSAGYANGPICNCPIFGVGNCVCAFTQGP